jgi:hypothetical protein
MGVHAEKAEVGSPSRAIRYAPSLSNDPIKAKKFIKIQLHEKMCRGLVEHERDPTTAFNTWNTT